MAEMKNSGISWIGAIPNNWDIVPHKYVMHKEKSLCEHYEHQDIISLTMGGVIVRDLYAGGKMPTTFDGYQFVEPGDLLLCLFDIDVTPRCVGLVNNYGLTSPAYSRYKVHDGICNAYYDYLLRYIDDKKVFVHLSKNLRSSLNEDDFSAIKTIKPSFLEQQRIAEFLDRKCTDIDNILEKTKASIEEYKKLKQSIITEAVTKGIRSDRPMKDSGIEWIGTIPNEWSIIKFGRFITIKSNLVDPTLYPDYPQIAPDCIGKGTASIVGEIKTVKESGVISWNHLFHKGQIIYSKIRPLLNKLIIAPFDGLCSADMYPIECVGDTSFTKYILLSSYFLEYIKQVTEDRVKMPKVNQEELTSFEIAVPETCEEQKEIASFLDQKCSEIDNLINSKEAFIKELETYRKSLIYEYVTGKKEVSV